jgi:hypothetical protein
MLVLVIVAPTVIALIALASAAPAILRLLHRRRTDDPLGDDWWPQFEQAFRDYVRSRSSSAS